MTMFMRVIALLACLACAGPAYAFKQVPVEGTTDTKPLPGGAVEQPGVPGMALEGTQTLPSSSDKGTELRIPGIGSLGTVPKLDFGLELLYGATDKELPQNELNNIEEPADDMTIRGTLKHNF